MNTLTLIVLALLGLAFVLIPGTIVYLAYRHPAARAPITVGLTAIAAMAALLGPIITR